jgi:transcriptional regulator with XRE-family HTH domain
MDIGDRMLKARKQAGLTQQRVGEAIGVHKSSVSQYESNQSRPTLENLVAFCELTNISLDWLILGRETPKNSIDKRINDLPEALREYVMEALKLAESAKQVLPVQFLRAPTSETYLEFSDLLAKLPKDTRKVGG